MKKVILALLSLATVALVACNKGKEESKTEETKVETTTEETEVETTTDDVAEVPAFDNEKVGEYIKLYDSYLEEYKGVVNSKDMTKFQALSTKGQELAQKAQALTTEGLSAADTKKLNDYMQEKAKELQELSKKMMQ